MKKHIVIDHRNTNKQLRHYDHEGDFMRLSVDETIARGLNQWKGWSCSAGVNNLYIDYDGNVWVCNTASSSPNRFNVEEFRRWCRADPEKHYDEVRKEFLKSDVAFKTIFQPGEHPGLLGNIATTFDLPQQWIKCQWDHCACGADVFLSKAKDGHQDKLAVHHRGFKGRDETDPHLVETIEASTLTATETNFPLPRQILWDLGRRCNFDCSYCWPSAHNRDAPHLSLEVMKATADKVIADWANGNQIRWNFGGGEPTLNPDFLPFVKYLRERGQWVLVTTNGSRPRKYWKDAIQYINSVNLSVHFEYINEQKLLENIEEICNFFDTDTSDHWLEIKLMSPPESLQRAIKLRDQINEAGYFSKQGGNGKIHGTMSIVPIRSKDSGNLIDYTEEDLKIIQHQ